MCPHHKFFPECLHNVQLTLNIPLLTPLVMPPPQPTNTNTRQAGGLLKHRLLKARLRLAPSGRHTYGLHTKEERQGGIDIRKHPYWVIYLLTGSKHHTLFLQALVQEIQAQGKAHQAHTGRYAGTQMQLSHPRLVSQSPTVTHCPRPGRPPHHLTPHFHFRTTNSCPTNSNTYTLLSRV